MQLTEIKIHLCPADSGRLKAFCSITLDNEIVVRDLKIIDGDSGLFVAMPSRKLCDHCPRCHDKNHLKARFCNQCGSRLNENRHQRYRMGADRLKLHADIAHPVNARTRARIEQQLLSAFGLEIDRSHEPGYIPTPMDTDVPELSIIFKSGVV